MTPTRRPKVATITVGTNELSWLDHGLGSLLQSDTTGFDLEVYFVDNDSSDGSAEHVDKYFDSVRIIRNERNLGFSGANNVGMRAALDAGADYVFLVNPDTWSPPDLVRRLVEFAERWSEHGVVGPLQYQYDPDSGELGEFNEWSRIALWRGEQHVFAGDEISHPSHVRGFADRAPRSLEHAFVQGSALFVRASVLHTVGLFDEVFHTYYEEVDLCRRARWAGWKVALHLDIGIQHYGGGSSPTGSDYTRVHMRRNRYYYLLTDIDWSPLKAARLASRWVVADLRGHGVGGRTTPANGTRETARAFYWLVCAAPVIRDRRARNRALRRRGDTRRGEGRGKYT